MESAMAVVKKFKPTDWKLCPQPSTVQVVQNKKNKNRNKKALQTERLFLFLSQYNTRVINR